MSIVEMVQTQADHPGADRDPSDQKRTGAKTARRDESETENRDRAHDGNRERTVRVREYLVCQSQVQNYIRHADRSTKTSVSVPDAEAENAKHDRSHAQAVCQSKKRCGRESEQSRSTVTQQTRQRGSSFQQQYHMNSGTGQSRKPRAASEQFASENVAHGATASRKEKEVPAALTSTRVKRADPQRVKRADPQWMRTRQVQRDDELSTETARCFSGKQSPDQQVGSETVENKISYSTV